MKHTHKTYSTGSKNQSRTEESLTQTTILNSKFKLDFYILQKT